MRFWYTHVAMKKKQQVVIVGGGPVGMAIAIAIV
jgi:cation diffusion facilitator CzcD-associated flavoprotein CzcO